MLFPPGKSRGWETLCFGQDVEEQVAVRLRLVVLLELMEQKLCVCYLEWKGVNMKIP